jgi:Arc/MetJ-type ribon-helix-helix transcriptional regulator
MTVHIKPELEAIMMADLKDGGFASAEEYIENAIQMLHEERLGPIENREEIAAMIEEGWEAAERGELIDADDAIAQFQAFRAEWLREHGLAGTH